MIFDPQVAAAKSFICKLKIYRMNRTRNFDVVWNLTCFFFTFVGSNSLQVLFIYLENAMGRIRPLIFSREKKVAKFGLWGNS